MTEEELQALEKQFALLYATNSNLKAVLDEHEADEAALSVLQKYQLLV